jgi:hypothetical protein
MAERETGGYLLRSTGGVVSLHSPRLLALEPAGIVHAFATRQGGVSEGSFASLNFGLKGGDPPARVAENLDRLAGTLGLDAGRCYRARQVHGRTLREVRREESPASLAGAEADGLFTCDAGCAVGVLTADCVPVLLADPVRRRVAAVHAGWRGIVGGVLEAAVAELAARGAVPAELVAAAGPAIGPCCYEVGPEVAAAFSARFPEAVSPGPRGRPHLDLAVAVRAILVGLGLVPARIERPALCTRCRADLCYSYRRDGDATGHHLSLIGIR